MRHLWISGATVIVGLTFQTVWASEPPPPPPPSSLSSSSSNILTKETVGRLLRNGVRTGVITRKEGITEEDIVKAMMEGKGPVQQGTEKKSLFAKKAPVVNKTQAEMMQELQAKLKMRSSGSLPD